MNVPIPGRAARSSPRPSSQWVDGKSSTLVRQKTLLLSHVARLLVPTALTISHDKRDIVADLPVPERLFCGSFDHALFLHATSLVRGVVVVLEEMSDIPLAL